MRDFFNENSISYTGIDYTAHFVEKAKLKYPEVNWEQGDVRNLPFNDDSFDYVFIYHVLEHQKGYEDVQKAIQELGRIAKRYIMIIWFKKPTFAHETRGGLQKDGFYYYKYSVADVWKAIRTTDFVVKKIPCRNNRDVPTGSKL